MNRKPLDIPEPPSHIPKARKAHVAAEYYDLIRDGYEELVASLFPHLQPRALGMKHGSSEALAFSDKVTRKAGRRRSDNGN